VASDYLTLGNLKPFDQTPLHIIKPDRIWIKNSNRRFHWLH